MKKYSQLQGEFQAHLKNKPLSLTEQIWDQLFEELRQESHNVLGYRVSSRPAWIREGGCEEGEGKEKEKEREGKGEKIKGERERSPVLLALPCCSPSHFPGLVSAPGPIVPSFWQISLPPSCHLLMYLALCPQTLSSQKGPCQGCLPCLLPFTTSNPIFRASPHLRWSDTCWGRRHGVSPRFP